MSGRCAAIVALLVVVSAAGCDYIGPGASGVISLGPAVDATAFETLAMRAFADPSAAFDPGQAIPGGHALDESISGLTFPFPYRIGGYTNEVSDDASWMFVAWLSTRSLTDVDHVESGDVFCAVPFRVPDCQLGNYCGITANVDCTIATVAP